MDYYIILLLCLFAFLAGFIDSIVGGGGLIQTPAAIVLLPSIPVSTIIGTLKIPAFSGTSFATFQYLKKVKIRWKLFLMMFIVAFSSAYFGSWVLNSVSNDFMKPVLFIIIICVTIYTFKKKNLGQASNKVISDRSLMIKSFLICLLVGFYDGFIGPGTGSFFILTFVSLLGMDFLKASAYSKLVNLSTNFGSIVLFLIKGKIIWTIAIPMAICNGLGGFLGSKLAIKKGNSFIRKIFLFVLCILLIRFAWDLIGSKF